LEVDEEVEDLEVIEVREGLRGVDFEEHGLGDG
jgi:hypothetical protein